MRIIRHDARLIVPRHAIPIHSRHELDWWSKEVTRLRRAQPRWGESRYREYLRRKQDVEYRLGVAYGSLRLHDSNGGASSPYTTTTFNTASTLDIFCNVGSADTGVISSVSLNNSQGNGTLIKQATGTGGVNVETSQAYYWLNVPSFSGYAFTITGIGAGVGVVTHAFDLTGVNHTTVINSAGGGAQTINTGNLGTPATMTVTSASGNLVIGQITTSNSSVATPGGTLIRDDVVNLDDFNSQYYAGAASVTVSWTVTNTPAQGTGVGYDVVAAASGAAIAWVV